MKPKRLQRKRTKGFRLPPNTVCVTRGTKYGNPFVVGVDGTATECVRKFIAEVMPYTHRGPRNDLGDYLISEAFMTEAIYDLKGKNLACYCKPGDPCHADFLLRLVNHP